jgi:hypothetical protein
METVEEFILLYMMALLKLKYSKQKTSGAMFTSAIIRHGWKLHVCMYVSVAAASSITNA